MSINSINTINGFQLSPQQKHLWLLQQLEVDNQPYRMQCSVLIEGKLNYQLLELVLQKVVEKYEIFRTSFQTLKGMNIPLQVIHEATNISNLSINTHNLIGIESQKHNAEIENIFQQQNLKTFDWKSDCVLDLQLVTLSDYNHILLIAIPAICADTVSIHNLVEEISRLYTAYLHEQELSEETLQYADIAAWQNELFEEEGEDGEVGREFWQNQNISNLVINKLASEKHSANKLIFQPQFININLNHNTVAKIKALANSNGVSISTILMACWQILLSRLTGQSEMTIAMCCDGRNYDELKPAIGLLAKYIPVSVDLSGNFKFSEIIKQLEENINEIQQWQDSFSWEEFVGINETNAESSFLPFAFDFNSQTIKYFADDVSFSISKQYACVDKFKVKLSCQERNNSLLAELHYDASLFEREDIENLAIQLNTLLSSAINNPANAISQLEILSPNQRQKILVDFNATQTNYSQSQCIHELIEQQAAKTPNNLAVVFENQQLTYAQLNARANQLAHHLKALGVGAETVVALCVERSLEMCVGFLGILKAGGAYVALDSLLPEERLAYMIQDAGTSVILTQQHLAGIFSQQEVPTVCLDSDWHSIAEQLETNLPCEVTPDNLVYVVYTSGSTGKPKGVAVEHRQLFNYLQSILEKLNLPADSSFATVSTFAADLGNTSIFPALCIGGYLHIISQERATNPEALIEYCDRHTIDCLKIVPSHLMALLSASQPEKILPRKRLVIGGEALSSDLVKTLRQYSEDCQIINHYGPSETTVGVSTFPVNTDNNWEVSDIVTIGRPLGNTQIYILDHYLQPLPIGVSGEIYIGGNNLTRGYLNHPEITSEKFIPNPFSDKLGSRLYKTGDLARYLPDGKIEFLGRADHQVKIRGFRIELSEIESVIRQHPKIKENIVLTKEEQSGTKGLVAYFVSTHEPELSSNDLRDFLQQKLPDYMIPSTFIQLKALPLTPNGKIDRQALPSPESINPELAVKFVAPRNSIEKTIANIWSGVLKIERVGIYDNFFELGGDSIISIQIIARLNQAGLQLTPKQLFDSPTVAGLAAVVGDGSKLVEATSIERIPRSQQLPLSFAQQRLWFLAQLEPDSPFYNIPAAVRLEGKLNIEALQQSFNEIVRRHEALRTNFLTIEGQALAVISEDVPLRLSILDISSLSAWQQEAEVKQQATQEAQQPFDIGKDHLLRVKLLRLGKQEHIVLLTMHHIVSDGWSVGVLVQEFSSLYSNFCKGEPISCQELPIQYVDFAAWQRQWLQGEVLETQISYWLKQLENAPKVLELPTDHQRPAIQTYRGANYSFKLSKELSAALNKLSQQQGSTLFMTLLAGFQTLLWRYTAQEDIVVGSPIANRNRAEIEGLIGFFVNTLVLRTNLAGNPSFEELLKRVREVALAAYGHQDLPFELLVEQLKVERDLSHSPLFQVMFVLQNAPMSALELPDLTLTPLEGDSRTAKFDLTLQMTETESGLIGNLEYNIDLFEESSIQRMVSHLQTLLSGIVANPQQRLSELPLLAEFEQHQLLVEWNNTEVDYPQDKCIHELFEAQVEKTPDAIAVVFEDRQLTYWELNVRANQLAHHLRSLGVKPEVLVGICVERSLEMVIGLLAILKAGGAYVPLDPRYPKERLAFMLEDASVSVLLIQEQLVRTLPSHKAKLICLDTDWNAIAQESQENPLTLVESDNLAYVNYTSGSTGKPKGVEVLHRGVIRLLFGTDYVNLDATQRFLQMASISFDASTFELWGALLHGARCVLFPGDIPTPKYLSDILQQQNITILWMTAALFNAVIDDTPNVFLGIQQLLIGGEALSVSHILRAQEILPSTQIINGYGPTESTTFSCCYPIPRKLDSTIKSISIGHPIGNTEVYLLNAQLKSLPIGVIGELYIGGAGLARGYLNRPELTTEKFIPNPFSDELGSRLYKTGDLARYLPNGDIEYLGRIDNQVKVRGFRIELGEIEAVISQYPGIRETVVLVREDSVNSQRIVAYVVAQTEQTLTISELRSFLESKLPNYTLPAAFVTLEALPLTPNGKVDRKALPVPDQVRPELEAVYIPPQTEVEKTIANIWQEVLCLEEIGIHDNFFELGGHSLLLVQVHSKLQKIFQQLSIVDLFQYPTINYLAKYLTQKQDREKSVKNNARPNKSRTASINRRKQARKNYRTAKQK